MQYDFDQPHPRGNTGSIKWDFLLKNGELRQRQVESDPLAPDALIPMWLADMDFPTPRPVIDALISRVEHGIFGYTMPPHSYYETIVSWMERRHGWPIQRDWIVTTPGVMQSINLSIQTFTNPEDGVIIQTPLFRPIIDAIENNGRLIICNPLRYDGTRYSMDFVDLEAKAADPTTRMLILCNPHNPVGRVWSRDELSQLGQICRRHQVKIVSDEVHADLVYSWVSFTPFGTVDQRLQDHFITCYSASKSFNLPGLRTSLTIIPNDALRQQFLITLRNLNELFGVNTLGTLAMQTAFEKGEGWLAQLMAYLEANYHYLANYLRRHLPQLELVPPEGLFLVWVDCRALGMTSDAVKQLFLNEARVWLESGSDFGAEGEGFLRINIACSRSVLATALERIRRVVASSA